MKASTCARDRRALQQLALNVHVKSSDLTCSLDTGPDGAVVMSSANGLVGIGFAFWYQLQPIAGF